MFQSFKVARFQVKSRGLGFPETLKHGLCVDHQKEVRVGSCRVCGAGRFSLDHAVGRADSSLGLECETAKRHAAGSGTVRVSSGTVFLANPDRGRTGKREVGRLNIDLANLILALSIVVFERYSEPM